VHPVDKANNMIQKGLFWLKNNAEHMAYTPEKNTYCLQLVVLLPKGYIGKQNILCRRRTLLCSMR
jgi:hypothetical protein